MVFERVLSCVQGGSKGSKGVSALAISALLAVAAGLPVASAQQQQPKNAVPAGLTNAQRQQAAKLYSGLPLLFERNQGQSAPEVDFLSRTPAYTLFLTRDEAVIQNSGGKKSTLRMQWLGSNAKPAATPEQATTGKSNYFIGNDPSKWQTGVANYQRVRYSSVYPGVDLLYYGNNQKIEYDLDVAPGADPAAIRLHFTGATKLQIEKQTGDLLVTDQDGEVRFQRPDVYQGAGTERQTIAGAYVLSAENTVSFKLGAYDHNKELVIDPSVVYSTVIGGSDSAYGGANILTGLAVDGQGFVYLQGYTAATNFPTTSAAYQPTCNSAIANQCSNFFVAKFDTTQSGAAASLVYSTLLGGTETKVSEGDPSAYYQPNDLPDHIECIQRELRCGLYRHLHRRRVFHRAGPHRKQAAVLDLPAAGESGGWVCNAGDDGSEQLQGGISLRLRRRRAANDGWFQLPDVLQLALRDGAGYHQERERIVGVCRLSGDDCHNDRG